MSALPAFARRSRSFLNVKRLFLSLEPVIHFGAELIAALDIEFISATAEWFFERKLLNNGFLCVRMRAWVHLQDDGVTGGR